MVGMEVGMLIGTVTGGARVGVSEGTVIGLYLTYALIAVSLVVFLARTLYQNGQVFLESSFDEPELAHAVNKLLVIGFYLLNLGYALLVYQLQPQYDTLTAAFNELVVKLGVLLLSLGVVHLFNMLVFWRIRSSRDRANHIAQQMLPPASAYVPPPPPPQPYAAPQTAGFPPPEPTGSAPNLA
ncbi:MAG: hypothetical protein AAGA65_13930 [Actinomycetota bacterium]